MIKYKRLLAQVKDLELIAKDDYTDDLARKLSRLLLTTWGDIKKESIEKAINEIKRAPNLDIKDRSKSIIGRLGQSISVSKISKIEEPIYKIINPYFQVDFQFGKPEAVRKLVQTVTTTFQNKPAQFLKGYIDILEQEGLNINKVITHMKTWLKVPEKYKMGSYYYSQLAQHVNTTAHSIRQTYKAEQMGAKALEISAVMDDKTSDICQTLNGRKIPIEQAKTFVGKVLNTNPNNYGDIIPWPDKNDPIAGLTDHPLPPYHFGCRTIVVPIV